MVKERVVPAFLWPGVGLAPILYGSPIAQPYGVLPVHIEVRLQQSGSFRFALQDIQMGSVFPIIPVTC